MALALCSLFLSSIPGQALAGIIKAGAMCTKLGATAEGGNLKFSCIKSRNKLVWGQGISIPLAPSTAAPQLVTLQSVVQAAQAALTNPAFAIPAPAINSQVSITRVAGNTLNYFVQGSNSNSFEFFGPTPLVENSVGRAGAVSLMTEDHRMVYGSQNALPPWAIQFKINTQDATGRFIVETSGEDTYSWRLAYRSVGGTWNYQSLAGVSRTGGAKNFDLITLGGPGNYEIRVELPWNAVFYGIGLSDNPTAIRSTVATTNSGTPRLRVAILGDSWTTPALNEAAPWTPWDAYPGILTWLSGWNVISAGVSGQGYLHLAAGETYRDRIVRDLVPQKPDVVIFTGSPNDHCPSCSFTDDQIAKEMGNDVHLLQQADPHAVIIVCSPFLGQPTELTASISTAMKIEIAALQIPYVNFIDLPLFDKSNNGQNQLLNGHPTKLGSAYIARILLQQIANLK